MHFGYLALYGGPDQLMPLTSSLAAIFAFVLMFWGKLLVAFDKMIRFFKGTPAEPVAAPVATTTVATSEESKAKE
jgi:hypothetical protein